MRRRGLHRAVLASLRCQIAVLDRHGDILEVNDAWRRASECLSDGLPLLLPGQNALRSNDPGVVAQETREALLAVLQGTSAFRQMELCIRCRNAVYWFEQTIEKLRRAEGGAVITRSDVTPRKRAELEVREQQQRVTLLARAAALGEFSGSIAHEISQPLGAIRSNAEAAIQLLEAPSQDRNRLREILEDIIASDVRANDIIQRMHSLLRRGERQRLPLDVNEVVREALALARMELAHGQVRIGTCLAEGLGAVSGDRVQLQQILLNLISNATEAMSGNAPADRRLVLTTQEYRGGSGVEVIVRDFGTGVAPAHLERIFQPFFTTRPTGLGLGLSICRTLAEAHEGRLWAENETPGTAFHLVLPVHRRTG